MKRLKRLINNETPVTNDEEELDDEEDNGEERDASRPADNLASYGRLSGTLRHAITS